MPLPRASGWLLAAFTLLLVLVAARVLVGTDRALFALGQLPQDCRLIGFSNIINLLFSGEGCLALCVLSSLLLVRAGYGRWSFVPWLILGSVPIEVAAKIWVYQPGPGGVSWPAQAGCGLTEPPVALGFNNSFPSGHITRAAYFAMLLVGLAGGPWRWPGRALAVAATLVVFAVGLERVYRGVHWPSDVAGGFLLGPALALISVHLLTVRRRLNPV